MSASPAPAQPTSATPARRWRLRRLLALLALAAVATLYYALSAHDGIISTNDGSHYALTKALAVDHSAKIDPYVNYAAVQPARGTPSPANYIDLSYYDGHYYSDRPPGTAFLAVPFYWLGIAVDAVSGRLDLDFPLRYVTMLPPLLGAATVLALALLARGLGASWPAATTTALIGGLTTLILKYATLLYSHITGAAIVTGGVATVLLAETSAWTAGRPARRRWLLGLGGLLLGYSALTEYPNILLVVPVGLYLLWRARATEAATPDDCPPPADPQERLLRLLRPTVIPFAVGWFPPIAVLFGYNWVVFGRPWHTSYTYQYYFPWSRSIATTYIPRPGYMLEGLRWLLLGPSGLFVITPAFVVALWGLLLLARRSPDRALLLIGVILIILVPTTAHRTYQGGGSQDTRYLLAIVPALLAPLAIWFDRVAWPPGRPVWLRLVLLAPVAALCAWGLLRSFISLLRMFGHRASGRTPEQALDLLRSRWRDLQIVAPGYFLLHYFVVLVVPLALAIWLASILCEWGFERRSGRATASAAVGDSPS